MSCEDKFISMCTKLPFEEIRDERDEFSVPELKRIAEFRDSGQMQEAVDYGKTLMKMYPDNDLIPFMIAYIYYQQQFPDEALQVAVDAIPHCPRKYRLYSVAGLAEFRRERLPEALVWWSRGAIAQCTITDFQEHDPFLHLAHAAEQIGARREAQALFAMSDAIEPDNPRLSNDEIERLAQVKRSWAAKPFGEVVKKIDKDFLHV